MIVRCGGRALVLAIGIMVVMMPLSSVAAKIVLRIRVGNPLDREQTVQIRQPLPEGVTTNAILSLGGLELGYDVKNDLYFVHRNMMLGPKQVQAFDVEIDDIWTIPAAELSQLESHANALADKLRGHRKYGESGEALRRQVINDLQEVSRSQAAKAIGTGVKPVDHIRVYEANRDVLKKVMTDLGRLENLVLFTNQDPGELIGDDQNVPKPRDASRFAEDTGKTAIVRVSIENTSSSRRRENVKFRRYLPPEIRAKDVVDTDGLDLGVDDEKDLAYVYADGLELDPGATMTFNVVIKDRWDVNEARIDSLYEQATNMLVKVAARGRFESVEVKLGELIVALQNMQTTTPPQELNADYVSFFREQTDALDDVEQDLQRIVINLPQIDMHTKLGFKPQPPSMKTTWLIIWIILGFLAIISVGFFIRWSGRSQAERMDRDLRGRSE